MKRRIDRNASWTQDISETHKAFRHRVRIFSLTILCSLVWTLSGCQRETGQIEETVQTDESMNTEITTAEAAEEETSETLSAEELAILEEEEALLNIPRFSVTVDDVYDRLTGEDGIEEIEAVENSDSLCILQETGIYTVQLGEWGTNISTIYITIEDVMEVLRDSQKEEKFIAMLTIVFETLGEKLDYSLIQENMLKTQEEMTSIQYEYSEQVELYMIAGKTKFDFRIYPL